MKGSIHNRTKVFISYSHKDSRFLTELQSHLGYFARNQAIDFWVDTKIMPGSQWREGIGKAIESAKVAVLLVSADFLNSEFIAKNELPPLLAAAKYEGAIILPVIIRPCAFTRTNLGQFQAVNNPSEPLSKMSKSRREEEWTRIVKLLEAALNGQETGTKPSNAKQSRREAKTPTPTESSMNADNEAALQTYIKAMSELLLEKKLRESAPEDVVRTIARELTLTVLPRLDGTHKRNVLRFLFDTRLINKGHQIIDVRDADLSEADLSEVSLWRIEEKKEGFMPASADLSGVNLRNANLNGANLSGVKLGVDVESEDGYLLEYQIARLNKRTIAANLSNAKLVSADLSNAVLGGVDLRGADLSEANLDGANLQYADLRGANLHGADLSIKSFIQPGDEPEEVSTWTGANLSGADLRGANLSGANLRQADLSDADLRGANLSGADLKGAVGITREKLEEQAESLKGATMLDGSTCSW